MKRTYILPTTTTVAFHAGLICAGSPTADPGINVGGGTLAGGGEAIPGSVDPM